MTHIRSAYQSAAVIDTVMSIAVMDDHPYTASLIDTMRKAVLNDHTYAANHDTNCHDYATTVQSDGRCFK